MTQGSYSLTSETLTVLATAFTDQGDQLGVVVAGSNLINDAFDGMDLAWGNAGTSGAQRELYLVPRELALESLEVLCGVLRNVGTALSDLALRYQAAETQASAGFTQVGNDLSAAGG
jgi:hypothetical protein